MSDNCNDGCHWQLSANGEDKTSVALIGLRGSGKSTVGPLLAALMRGQSVDSDEEVVRRAGRTIAEIFEENGETAFRKWERVVVGDICVEPPAVISVGGGAVLDDENVRRLREVATIVWLTAPADILHNRIQSDEKSAALRPALTSSSCIGEIEQLEQERRERYESAADFSVDTVNRSPVDVAEFIVQRLDREG